MNERAAEDLFHLLFVGDREHPFLGTGTAIVAAALLAGTQLFRNTGLDRAEGIEPGAYVLIDSLNEEGIALLGCLEERLRQLTDEPPGDWNLPELSGTGPEMPLLEITTRYETAFRQIMGEHGVSDHDAPAVAIGAAALGIHRASAVMNSETGQSIVAQALVHACKHMPPPRPE